MQKLPTSTAETFSTTDGRTIRYQDFFEGVADYIDFYSRKFGKSLRKEDLEDLQQDACLKVVRYHHSYKSERSTPRTFASSIADNCKRDAVRKAGKREIPFTFCEVKDKDDEFSEPRTFGLYRGDEFEADREILANEAFSYIQEKMASLSESHRQVLKLHLEGLKPQKMAERLGCSASAASTLLHRARKALAKALGPEFLSEYGLCA